jgi:hypothetical protein
LIPYPPIPQHIKMEMESILSVRNPMTSSCGRHLIMGTYTTKIALLLVNPSTRSWSEGGYELVLDLEVQSPWKYLLFYVDNYAREAAYKLGLVCTSYIVICFLLYRCGASSETILHILRDCLLAKHVWPKVRLDFQNRTYEDDLHLWFKMVQPANKILSFSLDAGLFGNL